MIRTTVITLLAIASLSCLRSSAQTTAAKENAAVHAGEEVFIQKCFQCHSVLEGQVRLGPSLYGEMKKPHPKKSAAEVREIIKNGKGRMPPFKDSLTEQNTDDLLAYIHSL
jgi:mono/diheme cytochrome c family protein